MVKEKLFVIGEAMLDTYMICHSNRLAPDGCVPVCNLEKVEYSLGGAANSALALKRLGSPVELISLAAYDTNGDILRDLLNKHEIDSCAPIVAQKTINKLRIFSGNHYIARVDDETPYNLSEEVIKSILCYYKEWAAYCKVLCICDYGKNFLVPELCQGLINIAKQNNTFIIVDPKRYDRTKYYGSSLICPNMKELCDLVNSGDELEGVKILLENIDNVLLTKSEFGCTLYEKNGDVTDFPSLSNGYVSVNGSGDVVLASVAHYVNLGKSLKEAAAFAMETVAKSMQSGGTVNIS